MKSRLLLAFFFAAPVATFAQSGITGIWKATDVGFAPWTLTLQADGSQLTGTVSQGAADPASSYMTSLTAPVGPPDGTIKSDNFFQGRCPRWFAHHHVRWNHRRRPDCLHP